MELSDIMDRVEELQSMNYEMLDYLRTQLAWLLEYCKENRIPLPDFDKAMLFFKRSGKILSDENIRSSKNNPSDEEEYRTLNILTEVLYSAKMYSFRRIDSRTEEHMKNIGKNFSSYCKSGEGWAGLD